MEFIKRFKMLLGFSGATPAQVDASVPTNKIIVASHANDSKQKEVSIAKSKAFEKKLVKFAFMTIKLLSKVFVGAIILVVLAHFAPELREQVPSLYKFVDLIMNFMELLFANFWQVIDKLL